MREIGPEEVQRFVSSIKLSGKTVKNVFATIQKLWKSARVWGYVAHDAVSEVTPPKGIVRCADSFRLKRSSEFSLRHREPYHTIYWLDVETGIRAGELCGIRVSDIDVERGLLWVRQSVWR